MNQFVQLSLLFILALISSSLLTRILIKKLSYLGVVDKPGDRRAHKKITPRGGGLSVVAVLIIGFIAFEYLSTNVFIESQKIIPIFSLIAAISFLDDLKTIRVFFRLITHLICAGLSIYLFLYPRLLFHGLFPMGIDFILATICLVGFLNIYNFLDGIDGITAAESIHLSITLLILCYLRFNTIINVNFIIAIATITLACSIGFLIFNWHPAMIFLGDVGSISLGFLIGLCLLLISASTIELFIASGIASLYYIADGSLTIFIRLINKERIWQPHLKHFFQKAIKKGMTQKQVVHRIIICNSLLMVFSISSLVYPVISSILAATIVMVTLINFAR